jgi:hypothetical protein
VTIEDPYMVHSGQVWDLIWHSKDTRFTTLLQCSSERLHISSAGFTIAIRRKKEASMKTYSIPPRFFPGDGSWLPKLDVAGSPRCCNKSMKWIYTAAATEGAIAPGVKSHPTAGA